jgi:HEPN domain-containing protein
MTVPQNSLYVEDWKDIARKDWERIKRNLKEGDAEAAGFFFQQALEKFLKAFLLERKWELRKIHTLATLLDYAVEYAPHLEEFRTLCERVTDYYFTERYPKLTTPELSLEDIKKDLEGAKNFVNAIFPRENLNA